MPINNLAVQYWPMLNSMVDTSAILKGKEKVAKDGRVINRDLSKELTEVEVEFMDGPLGLDLYEAYPTEPAVMKVKRFNHDKFNGARQAEMSGLIKPHDYIVAVNGVDVTTMDYDKIMDLLQNTVRPFDVVFGREIMSDDEKKGSDSSESSESSDSSESDKKKKKSKKSKTLRILTLPVEAEWDKKEIAFGTTMDEKPPKALPHPQPPATVQPPAPIPPMTYPPVMCPPFYQPPMMMVVGPTGQPMMVSHFPQNPFFVYTAPNGGFIPEENKGNQ